MIFEIEAVSDKYPVLVTIIFAAMGWVFGRKINPGSIAIGVLYLVVCFVCLLSVPPILESVRYLLRKNDVYFLSNITPGWVDFLAFVLTFGYFMWENLTKNQIPPVKNTVKVIFVGLIGASLIFFFTAIFDPFWADFHDRQKEIKDIIAK